jgi:Ni/Fe-hydrogenase subunit HybB-like protein
MVFQNPRSVLTLVSWCLMSYMGVLGLQMIPVLCDWPLLTDRWPFLERIPGALHKVMPALALLGTFIGVTHQAAAGAAFGIVKARAVWYRPTITIVFIISAIFASLAFMLMVVTLTERVMGLRRQLVERELLINVGRIAAAIAIIGLFVRLAELAFTSYYSPLPFYKEQIDVLTTETPYALGVVVGEVVLGSIIPIIILLSPMNRKGRNLMLAGLLATFGLLLNRWSTALSGLVATTFYALNNPQITWNAYFPSWVEWLMVLGVVAYALLAYTLGVRLLPIFQPLEETVDPQITSQATVS